MKNKKDPKLKGKKKINKCQPHDHRDVNNYLTKCFKTAIIKMFQWTIKYTFKTNEKIESQKIEYFYRRYKENQMEILELRKYNNVKKVKLNWWPHQQNGGNQTEQRIRELEDTAIEMNKSE